MAMQMSVSLKYNLNVKEDAMPPPLRKKSNEVYNVFVQIILPYNYGHFVNYVFNIFEKMLVEHMCV